MHEHAVAYFDRDLRQVFVRAVHRIARLERRDARPPEPLEFSARFGGRHEQRAVLRFESAVRQHLHGPGEIHFGLLHHHLDARMLDIGGAKYGRALPRFLDGVFLGDAHRRERSARIGIDQRNVAADAYVPPRGRID